MKELFISILVCIIIHLIGIILKIFSYKALELYLILIVGIGIYTICKFVVNLFTKKGDK